MIQELADSIHFSIAPPPVLVCIFGFAGIDPGSTRPDETPNTKEHHNEFAE
jgi:hypothetical protein